jgi:hypothetical protein
MKRKGQKMRLIDADEFKKQVSGMAIKENLNIEKVGALLNLIDKQPTAYDPMEEKLRDILDREKERIEKTPDN